MENGIRNHSHHIFTVLQVSVLDYSNSKAVGGFCNKIITVAKFLSL